MAQVLTVEVQVDERRFRVALAYEGRDLDIEDIAIVRGSRARRIASMPVGMSSKLWEAIDEALR